MLQLHDGTAWELISSLKAALRSLGGLQNPEHGSVERVQLFFTQVSWPFNGQWGEGCGGSWDWKMRAGCTLHFTLGSTGFCVKRVDASGFSSGSSTALERELSGFWNLFDLGNPQGLEVAASEVKALRHTEMGKWLLQHVVADARIWSDFGDFFEAAETCCCFGFIGHLGISLIVLF